MTASPSFNMLTAINLLTFIHYLVNNKAIINIEDFFKLDAHSYNENEVYEKKTHNMIHNKENNKQHNTFYFEEEMLSYVRKGDFKSLVFFLNNRSIPPIIAGKMANSPLRQAKNIFIGTLTKVGNQAAIPGGMDVEDVYELIDAYSIECENLSQVDDISRLHYKMLIDFCEGVNKSRKQNLVSREIKKIMDFINERTNISFTLDEIVDFSGKSKSHLTKRFKNEVGMTIGEYINFKRMSESKDLLKYTDMSISEVANYLSYSSQSYFQNCFKKEFGETPNAYRKKVKISNYKTND